MAAFGRSPRVLVSDPRTNFSLKPRDIERLERRKAPMSRSAGVPSRSISKPVTKAPAVTRKPAEVKTHARNESRNGNIILRRRNGDEGKVKVS